MGWIMPALKIGTGLLGGFLGRGKSGEERFADKQLQAQAQRANEFWQRARGQQGAAQGFYAPILGGSRQAAMEALSPEIQGATQRMDVGRQSLLNLSSRSGGAGARVDPYAKGAAATDIMLQARPMAAQGMERLAGQSGGWAASQKGAPESMLEQDRFRKEQAAKRGAGMFDMLEGGLKGFGDWWKGRGSKSGG